MRVLFWMACVGFAEAEELSFLPEIQVRPRLEGDSGRDGQPEVGSVGFVTMRSRLGMTMAKGDVSGRVLLSDVRTFGEELHTRRDFSADGFDLRVGTLLWTPGHVEVEVGRMERGLHQERLMAIANWRQPGRSFDGARLSWDTGTWGVEARALLLREGDASLFSAQDQVLPGSPDGGMAFITGGRTAADSQVLPIAMLERDGDALLTRATLGTFSQGQRGSFRGSAEAYLQVGNNLERDILAGMVGLRGTWAPEASGKPTLGLGYDLLSGDGDATDDAVHQFTAPYGATHRYYGYVDMMMFVVGGQADGQGMHDAIVSGSITPTAGLTGVVDLHTFLAAVPLDARFLAVEPDIEVRIDLAPGLRMSNGLNLWLADDADASEWMAYSMLDLHL